ncbi:MAG: MBL fold metallo-hydrolase [Bacteroidota bacterium]
MKVKFYGTRGSIPVCEKGFQEFGGNTTCVLILLENGTPFILDAGSGIRNLGKDLLSDPAFKDKQIYLSFSHFHWDHIQGFPFFNPAYHSTKKITISAIGKGRSATNLKGIFETQMGETYFPIPLEKMGATFTFLQSEENVLVVENVTVTVLKHNHPGGAYSYRIDDGKSIVVFSTDVEHGEKIDEAIVALANGADVLIHDSQYTPEELPRKRGWGHSSWDQAIEVAKKAGVKQLILTHHDPDHNDEFLKEVEKECQAVFPDVLLAREKMEISC